MKIDDYLKFFLYTGVPLAAKVKGHSHFFSANIVKVGVRKEKVAPWMIGNLQNINFKFISSGYTGSAWLICASDLIFKKNWALQNFKFINFFLLMD